jgi:hypothetical protein
VVRRETREKKIHEGCGKEEVVCGDEIGCGRREWV